MHAGSPSAANPPFMLPKLRRHQQAGFSLVEVTMAIGIIAFAFVALLGLIPAGLTTFRSAIDTGNESRILQGITGRVQVTEFRKVPALDYSLTSETYYFDEEGTAVDTSSRPVPTMEPYRLYAARIFVEEPAERDTEDLAKNLNFSLNVMAVFANMSSPAMKEFEGIKTMDDLKDLLERKKGKTDVRVRSILVSKMDSAQ